MNNSFVKMQDQDKVPMSIPDYQHLDMFIVLD